MGIIKGVANVFRGGAFGIQGALDQAMAGVFMGAAKGTWGVTSGLFKGIAGMDAGLHNASLLGKVTGGIGYGAGRIIGAPIRPVGKFAFGASMHMGSTLGHDAGKALELGKKLVNAATTTKGVDKYADLGVGLMGRRMKKPVGWALGLGAVGLGAAGAAEDHSYQFGLKTAVNGIMDTQGVAVTPGSVNPSYTPIKRGKGINNHGATGDVVFAMHNKRNGRS